MIIDSQRGTGRTDRMLENVAAAIGRGVPRIIVFGASCRHALMLRDRLIVKVERDGRVIVPESQTRWKLGRSVVRFESILDRRLREKWHHFGDERFVDHYACEVPWL